MNTTAAAIEANVTVATIRNWCRRNVIAAVKTAGRWVIDAASLTHRIAIGATHKKANTVKQLPLVATSRTSIAGVIGVIGPADLLANAFQTGTPVTLDRKYAGEQVYLGHARTVYDDGLTVQVKGLDTHIDPHPEYPDTPRAVYLVDMSRLDKAPAIREDVDRISAARARRYAQVEAEAAAAEARVLRNTNY
ncbi:helix-turn-helix domain-containing protein (plasmid) [Streptomyces sp. NBC_00873]|uniref:hypothetical protein n=1 Tax=Streptomyces sp. NBC_00873 TaxID=2975852 RepID=UPI00386700CE|nr:helix-turn-helix domain-containing protein [Streptomyces sp. NBC_00873]